MTFSRHVQGGGFPQSVDEMAGRGSLGVWSDAEGRLYRVIQLYKYTEVNTVGGVFGVPAGDFVFETPEGLMVCAREMWNLTEVPQPVPEPEPEPEPEAFAPPSLLPADVLPRWKLQRERSEDLKRMCRDAHILDAGHRLDLIARLGRYADGTETSAY